MQFNIFIVENFEYLVHTDDFHCCVVVDFGMEKTYFHFDYPHSHFDYFLDYYHVDGWTQNICQEVEAVTFETYQLEILPNKNILLKNNRIHKMISLDEVSLVVC